MFYLRSIRLRVKSNKNVKEKEPMSDYNQKIQKIKKKLDNFKNAKEWSDFISLLTDVDNALKKVDTIPKEIEFLLTKRLNQSIHPALPAGVHNKALQTYELIISRMKLTDHMTLGLFSYGIYSKLSVRKNYFYVLEKLKDKAVKPCSYILGLLPFLEEENGQFFEPATRLIASQDDETAIWKNFLYCPELRIPVINYFKTRPVTISNILIKSIHKTLYDGESLTVRGTLDLLNKNVPLNDLVKYLNPHIAEFEYEFVTRIEGSEQPSQSETNITTLQTQNITSDKNMTLDNPMEPEKKRILVKDEYLHTDLVKLTTQILLLYLKKEVTINKKVNCWLQNDRFLQRKILKRIIDQDLDLFYKLFQNLIVQEELNDKEITDLLLYAVFKTSKRNKGFDIVYSLLENTFFWKMVYVEIRRVINNYRIGHSLLQPDEDIKKSEMPADQSPNNKSDEFKGQKTNESAHEKEGQKTNESAHEKEGLGTKRHSHVIDSPGNEHRHDIAHTVEPSITHSAFLKEAISEEQKNTINAVLGEQLPEKLVQEPLQSQMHIQATDTNETKSEITGKNMIKGGQSSIMENEYHDMGKYGSTMVELDEEKIKHDSFSNDDGSDIGRARSPDGALPGKNIDSRNNMDPLNEQYNVCGQFSSNKNMQVAQGMKSSFKTEHCPKYNSESNSTDKNHFNNDSDAHTSGHKEAGGNETHSNLSSSLQEYSRTDISDSLDINPDMLLSLLYFLFKKARIEDDQSPHALNMLLIVCANHMIFDEEMLNKCIRVLIQAIDMKKVHEYIKKGKDTLGQLTTTPQETNLGQSHAVYSNEHSNRENSPQNKDRTSKHINTREPGEPGNKDITASNGYKSINVDGPRTSEHKEVLLNSKTINKIDQMLDDHYISGVPFEPMLIFPDNLPLDISTLYLIVGYVNPFSIAFWHRFIAERDLHHNYFILQHILPLLPVLKQPLFKRLFYQYDEKLFCAYELIYNQGFEEFMIEEIREQHIRQIYGEKIPEHERELDYNKSHSITDNIRPDLYDRSQFMFHHSDIVSDNIITDRHLICLRILDYSFNVLNSIRFYRTLNILSNSPIHQFLSTLRSTDLFDHLLDTCNVFLIEKLLKYNHRFIRHIRKSNKIIEKLLPPLRQFSEQAGMVQYSPGTYHSSTHSSKVGHSDFRVSDEHYSTNHSPMGLNTEKKGDKNEIAHSNRREKQSNGKPEYKTTSSQHRDSIYHIPITPVDYNRMINILKTLLSLSLLPPFDYQSLYKTAALSFLYDTLDLVEHLLQDTASHAFFKQTLPLNNFIFRIKNREFNKQMYLTVIDRYIEIINRFKTSKHNQEQFSSEHNSEYDHHRYSNKHQNSDGISHADANHLEQSVAHLVLDTDTSRIDLFLLLETLKKIFKRRTEFNMEAVIEKSVCICSQVYELRGEHDKFITETVLYENTSFNQNNRSSHGPVNLNDRDSPFMYLHDVNSVLVQIFDILLQDPSFITFYMKYFNMRLLLNERLNRRIFLQILQKGKYGYLNRAFNQYSSISGNMPQLGVTFGDINCLSCKDTGPGNITNVGNTQRGTSDTGVGNREISNKTALGTLISDNLASLHATKVALNNIFYTTPVIHSREYFNHFFNDRIANMRKIETVSQLYFLMSNMNMQCFNYRLIEQCLTFLYKLLQNKKSVGSNIINMCLFNCGIDLMEKIKGNILGICMFIFRKEGELLVDIEARGKPTNDCLLPVWINPEIDTCCLDTKWNAENTTRGNAVQRFDKNANISDSSTTTITTNINSEGTKNNHSNDFSCPDCCGLRAIVLDAMLYHRIGVKEFFEWYMESNVFEGTPVCVLSRMAGVLRECSAERVFDLVGKLAMTGGIFSSAETLSQNNVEVLKKISFFIYSGKDGMFNTYITLIVPWINDLIVTSKSVRKEVFTLISIIFLRCDHSHLFSLFPIYSSEIGNNTFLEVLRSMEILMLIGSKESVELRWELSEGDSVFKKKLNEIYPGSATRTYRKELPKKRELLLREDKREFLIRVKSYYEQLDKEIWETDKEQVNRVILDWFKQD